MPIWEVAQGSGINLQSNFRRRNHSPQSSREPEAKLLKRFNEIAMLCRPPIGMQFCDGRH
jgi:hypothetical protein